MISRVFCLIQPFQNTNFIANWMSRGLLTVFVMLPKLADGRKLSGGPNCWRLKRLKNSVRNSRPSLSAGPNVVLLNTAKSKLRIPCWRSLESTRGSFPNVNAFGCEKQEVLNHSFSLDSALPDNFALQPRTRLGRAPAPKAWAKPLCYLLIRDLLALFSEGDTLRGT